MTTSQKTAPRTPRIAIMGEFSAGKSTLCNLLMRSRDLPERVTATRLSPIWMTKGPGPDVRVTLDGSSLPVARKALDKVPFEDTLYIRLPMDADILDHCDIIDFPGISDPNMDAEVWERVLVEADAVIWLTHATQAWRQTEAAVWETVPDHVRRNSILLVTRFDKLVSDIDRMRVLKRLEREAGPLFNGIFPISLTEALAGQDDYGAWAASGAAAVMDHLSDLICALAERPGAESQQAAPKRTATVQTFAAAKQSVTVGAASAPVTPKVVPRRVKPGSTTRTARPRAMRA